VTTVSDTVLVWVVVMGAGQGQYLMTSSKTPVVFGPCTLELLVTLTVVEALSSKRRAPETSEHVYCANQLYPQPLIFVVTV
jgi:hypothetical protein